MPSENSKGRRFPAFCLHYMPNSLHLLSEVRKICCFHESPSAAESSDLLTGDETVVIPVTAERVVIGTVADRRPHPYVLSRLDTYIVHAHVVITTTATTTTTPVIIIISGTGYLQSHLRLSSKTRRGASLTTARSQKQKITRPQIHVDSKGKAALAMVKALHRGFGNSTKHAG